MLNKPAHVQQRVLPLPPQRQHPDDLLDKPRQPIANRDRRRRQCERCLHPLLLER
jgi:hypothetical protein